MKLRQHSFVIAGAFVLLLLTPCWMLLIAPRLLSIPSDFRYQADIASYDDFFDQTTERYVGRKRSIAKYFFETVREQDGVLQITNVFDVRKLGGESIFSEQRSLAIDATSGKHVGGFNTRLREGYLFAPRNLQRGQPYTYWHVNYDAPANMKFVAEENIYGLPVYRYETHYENLIVDQTENLTNLPHVGESMTIRVEPYLQVWIEPVSGYMVQYKDDTVAYYHDAKTGERLHPWNHFSNTFTSDSLYTHVQIAHMQKERVILIQELMPLAFVLFSAIAFLVYLCRHKAAVCILGTGIALLVVYSVILFRDRDHLSSLPQSASREVIRLNVERGLLASSVWVAEAKGYFEEQGIELQTKEFSSGRAAFLDLLNDDTVNLATVAQTPFVDQSLLRSDFAILAGMVRSSDDVKLLARSDRGIHVPADLRGKTVGITARSVGHYFLELFMAQNALGMKDVRIVDLTPEDLVRSIQGGSVDAIVSWEPNIHLARQLMRDEAVVFESRGTFREDFYFVGFKEWQKKNSAALRRFVTAIEKASNYIQEHPQDSQQIVARRLQIDQDSVAELWQNFDFSLFLDQAILLNLEHQARWMMESGIQTRAPVPNYLELIRFDELEFVKPEAVTIIR